MFPFLNNAATSSRSLFLSYASFSGRGDAKKRIPGKDRKEAADREEVLTKEESRYYTWGALKAALIVVGVLCAGLVLFILFCQYVWFR